MRIYLLECQDGFKRLYAQRLGTVKTKIAEYSVYADYKGSEWLHVYYKVQDKFILWPFVRVVNGEEYIEYIKYI